MYWNPDHSKFSPETIELLNELRRYRQSNDRMRLKVSGDMGMGEKDLETLRLVLEADHRGVSLRQQDLARRLGITGASVSALVDRLTRSGYLRREPHPHDRRSVALKPTEKTRAEVEVTLRAMHDRMMEATERLSAHDKAVVVGFLRALNHSADEAPSGEGPRRDGGDVDEPA